MISFDKRVGRRLRLKRPAGGTLSGREIRIINLSASGAGLEQQFEIIPGKRARLEFYWGKQKLSLPCEIVRCKETKESTEQTRTYATGVTFYDRKDPFVEMLAELIRQSVQKSGIDSPASESEK